MVGHLTAISVANIVFWIVVARRFVQKAPSMEPSVRRGRNWQLALSAAFVLGCAFRSLLPRAEGQRICLYDSWLSTAVISRAVATVAELSLVAQWTIFLREYARGVNARLALGLSVLFIPLIMNAEIFSWYTTLTTNFIGSCVEESTWAVTALLIVTLLDAVEPLRGRAPSDHRHLYRVAHGLLHLHVHGRRPDVSGTLARRPGAREAVSVGGRRLA